MPEPVQTTPKAVRTGDVRKFIRGVEGFHFENVALLRMYDVADNLAKRGGAKRDVG